MKYFILCFSLIVLPQNASAEESRKPYWVVGSFDSMQDATDERRRLEYETGLPIQIASVNEGTTFRIHLPAAPRDVEVAHRLVKLRKSAREHQLPVGKRID